MATIEYFFAGPPSTFIHARHEEWVQTKSFLAKESRVVLVRRDIDHQRRASREEEREKTFRKRRSGESGVEYYCRVIRKRADAIELDYHGERVKVIQALLVESHKATFAVIGKYNTAQAMASELIMGDIGLNGVQTMPENFTVLSDKSNCDNNMYLIRSVHYDGNDLSTLYKAERIDVEVPSLRAIFTMKLWNFE